MKIHNAKITTLIMSMFLIAGCGGDGKNGEVSLDSLLVTVPDNISPVAVVLNMNINVIQGQNIILDASNSYDEDGSIISYEWQLADGTVLGNGKQFTYNTASLKVGVHKVRLIVTDNRGGTGVVEFSITIHEIPVAPPPHETTSSITHNGTTYGMVTSPYTGKVWLNKNLGAARVCEQFDDSACYGDYYQWGRNTDGHEDSGSPVTSTQATDVSVVGHGDFITSDDTYNYDWANTVDATGSKRLSNWSAIDGSSVCPVGFRVPTITELKAELLNEGSAQIENRDDAFKSFLKLPSAGYRYYYSGSLIDQNSWGAVWTISLNGSYSQSIYFIGDNAYMGENSGRAYGFTVRCIRD